MFNIAACSASNAIELGSNSFALTCASGYPLGIYDNKCYEICTNPSTGTSVSLCLDLPANSETVSSGSGLSGTFKYLSIQSNHSIGGAIAGIVIGSIVFVVVVMAVAAFAYIHMKKKGQLKQYIFYSSEQIILNFPRRAKNPKQAYMQTTSSPNTPATHTEAGPLKA